MTPVAPPKGYKQTLYILGCRYRIIYVDSIPSRDEHVYAMTDMKEKTITISVSLLKDNASFVGTLTHELGHILLAVFTGTTCKKDAKERHCRCCVKNLEESIVELWETLWGQVFEKNKWFAKLI